MEQYRATIGTWAACIRKIAPAPHEHPKEHFKREESTEHYHHKWHLGGPWKLHAILLILLLLSFLCHASCSTASNCPTARNPTNAHHVATSKAAHQDPTGAARNQISHQCLTALLMIAGVEPNPGPGSSDGNQVEAQKDIIAGLCASAPSTDIRDCLRLYKPQNTNKQHKTEFGRCPKPTLVATLDYLQSPGQDQFTKTTCINTLICRIQNYLPDKCNMCGREYCVALEDVSLLTCEICGQGSHNDCIHDQFGVEASDRDAFGPQEALSKLNPTSFPGLHYLCGACEAATIPDKKAGLLKNKRINSGEQNQLPNTQQSAGVDSLDHIEASNVPDETLETQSQDEEDLADETHDSPRRKNPPHGHARKDHKPKESQQNSVCRFYRQGTCRYGMVGRNCPRDHPPACKKLMKHGNRGPHGCTLGRMCQHFHPKMCLTSISRRECFKEDCKLRHVTGTKRKSTDREPESQTAPQSNTPQTTSNGNPFLEELKAMRAELMNQLDQRLAAFQRASPIAEPPTQAPPQATAVPTTMLPQHPQPTPTWSGTNYQGQLVPPVWPGTSYPSQMYTMWPRGQAAINTYNHGQGANTSHPTMLVQMPPTY